MPVMVVKALEVHFQNVKYLFTYLLAYFLEQSLSWEYNRFFASQETPHISWNPKVH